MRFVIVCLRVLALLAGVALIVSQVLQNLEYLGWPEPVSGQGLAAIVVPCAMAITVLAMELARGERRYGYATVALVVLLCGLGHTFIVALERSAHARDQVAAAKAGRNAPYALAMKAHADANARVERLEQELREARSTGCGSACKSLQTDVAAARTEVADKQRQLAAWGAPVETESMNQRYGPLATVIDVWHPVLQPMAVELGALVLIGVSLPRQRRAQSSPVNLERAPSKTEEAEIAIRSLRAERGSDIGSVREVAEQIGHSPTTTYRALRRVS